MAFSIGAISGAVVFLILSLTGRFKARFAQPDQALDLERECKLNSRDGFITTKAAHAKAQPVIGANQPALHVSSGQRQAVLESTVALLFGSTHFAINHIVFAVIVIVFYGLVQLLENQFLVPRIMGDAVDLPPGVVLIGIIAGAGAFGILGALLATPLIATGNLVFRYVYRKIIEAPPPPALEEE